MTDPRAQSIAGRTMRSARRVTRRGLRGIGRLVGPRGPRDSPLGAPDTRPQVEPSQHYERLEESVGQLAASVAALDRRLRETQQLAARTYERTFAYDDQLERARADDAYVAAYADQPLVTVVMPTYNRATLLCERALPSVLGQSHRRIEVIVVGNACTDETVERVSAIDDPRVTVINLPFQEPEPNDEVQRWHNSGSVPINVGIQRAKGSWIALQHDDDEWDPTYLERLLDTARDERAELVYARARMVRVDDGSPLSGHVGAFPPVLGEFGTQFAIFNAALRFFGYDRNCRFIDEPNDWNMARRMWESGVRFSFVCETLATYHFTPRTTGSREWMEQQFPKL